MNKEKRKEKLSNISMDGAQAANEFKLLTLFFLEKKAEFLDNFENKDTLDIDELQNIHRTYKNLCALEDFFLAKINEGNIAQTKLNSLQEQTNERSSH